MFGLLLMSKEKFHKLLSEAGYTNYLLGYQLGQIEERNREYCREHGVSSLSFIEKQIELIKDLEDKGFI